MQKAKRLIEVAMPVKEVSAESVRDKSIRHGHISTLHLWWARRPLPVCRAVVFASLVPDPLDPACPPAFREAVEDLLGKSKNPGDPYKPYEDIPYTADFDPMDDNARNRLLMFIGKFSDKYIANEKEGKATAARDLLSDHSLIKWDNKNNEHIITKARKLIWVAHQAENGAQGSSYDSLAGSFDHAWGEISRAENALYTITDRHKNTTEVQEKEKRLNEAVEHFLDHMPKVFDPFAGGGAIPLEASRLGCRTFANDLNPVAHIIEKGSLEFPQKFGKPITYTRAEFERLYPEIVATASMQKRDAHQLSTQTNEPEFNDYQDAINRYTPQISKITVKNRLAFDVEYQARRLLKLAEDEIGHFYPADEKGNKPVAYYWARVATCSNPSCQSKVPLLRDLYLVNKPEKKIFLEPIINKKAISFKIRSGYHQFNGWMDRANLTCPVCGNTTDVKTLKRQFQEKQTSEKLVAIIYDSEKGKEYRSPDKDNVELLQKLPLIEDSYPESMDNGNYRDLKIPKWGYSRWAEMFSPRQLLAMQTLVNKLQEIKRDLNPQENEYHKAVVTYLGIFIDRLVPVNTTFGRWNVVGEKIEHPFSRQAIPMIFDYPESNPFCNSTGSAKNHMEWIIRYINSESNFPFQTTCINSSSGEVSQFKRKSLDAAITDPPYFDAIAYADLSDFFYIWLKRTILDLYPMNFAFPQTPKAEECTALKHHHKDSFEAAKLHFENKLKRIFQVIEQQTNGLVSIMFAHQSTEAWTTLCNSILQAEMNISGSWAIDTEMGARMIAMDKAALESSVTVSCRPERKEGTGSYIEIKNSIKRVVGIEVGNLYKLGFRGADLLTACFGKAVGVFGSYKRVEKADGSEVTVAELLEMAKEAAFNAIVSDIRTDDPTRFYIGWLNLFGFTEAEHDDVNRIIQVGLNVDTSDLLARHILVRNGNRERLADLDTRVSEVAGLGEKEHSAVIDRVHRAMALFLSAPRTELLKYIAAHGASMENGFWRVVNALFELLPVGTPDYKAAAGLHANRESLVREARQVRAQTPEQKELGF
ncbi:MAG: DUF1156 domain-containing protein [Bacteroidales bacterium]